MLNSCILGRNPVRFLTPFLVSLVLLALTASGAGAQTSLATYSAFWAGLPVGTVSITNHQAAGEYTFSMTLQSGGILGGSRFTTTFSGNGALRGNPVGPYQGRFSDIRRNESRSEVITFGSGLPQFSSTPAYIIPPELQFDLNRTRGALDPASGMFALLQAASTNTCNQRFTVYDGFSLYQATISDEGVENVSNSVYDGPSRKCRLSLAALAGKAAVYGSFDVPEMIVNVAQIHPNGPAVPVKGALIVNGNRARLRLDRYILR